MKKLIGYILLLLMCAGCVHHVDKRLVRVSHLADCGEVDSATIVLQNIVADSLNEHNRNYYDLMSIKVRDKSYQDIKGDTVITELIRYFEDNGTQSEQAEAYYYGGRVYREMGDLPQSLDYFQKALDVLDDDDSRIRLRGKTCSQMGQMFMSMYMFEQAKPKFHEAIAYQIACADSIGLMYNYRNLAETHNYLKENDSVIPYYKKSLAIIEELCLNGADEVETLSSIADFYIMNNEHEKAFDIFTKIEPHLNNHYISNYARITAMHIYLLKRNFQMSRNIADTLLHTKSPHNSKFAYNVITEIARLTNDNENIYNSVLNYKNAIDSCNALSSKEAVVHQNSIYNYTQREKEIQFLKEKQQYYMSVIYIFIILCLFICFVVSYMYFKNNKLKFELALQLRNIENLKIKQNVEIKVSNVKINESVESIKKRIICEYIKRINKIPADKLIVPESILKSNVYCKIKKILNGNQIILTYEDWFELDAIINKTYPDFKSNLYTLYNKISEYEYHVCMLIKCRISNNDIGTLTHHQKSSVTTTRSRLFRKMFMDKGKAVDFDNFIYSL